MHQKSPAAASLCMHVPVLHSECKRRRQLATVAAHFMLALDCVEEDIYIHIKQGYMDSSLSFSTLLLNF